MTLTSRIQNLEAGNTGIERLITGIAMAHKDDENRLARGAAVFDDLYEYSGGNVTNSSYERL